MPIQLCIAARIRLNHHLNWWDLMMWTKYFLFIVKLNILLGLLLFCQNEVEVSHFIRNVFCIFSSPVSLTLLEEIKRIEQKNIYWKCFRRSKNLNRISRKCKIHALIFEQRGCSWSSYRTSSISIYFIYNYNFINLYL